LGASSLRCWNNAKEIHQDLLLEEIAMHTGDLDRRCITRRHESTYERTNQPEVILVASPLKGQRFKTRAKT
jgi:hypothetical protein